jgi:hypothetical protein
MVEMNRGYLIGAGLNGATELRVAEKGEQNSELESGWIGEVSRRNGEYRSSFVSIDECVSQTQVLGDPQEERLKN